MRNTPLCALVVDDEPLIRWSVSESLSDAGYLVAEAADAATAADNARAGRSFDVIVLDYELPDSNDLHLLQMIRELQPDAAVVMITAFGTPEMVSEALKLGAVKVIAKPFDLHVMVTSINHAYALRHASTDAEGV